MPSFARPIVRYDPVREAAERWHGWQIEEKHLEEGSERIFHDQRVIVIDLEQWGGDRDRAWAHVLVHIEYGHHAGQSEWLTDDQEDFADWLADMRLDRLDARVWQELQQ